MSNADNELGTKRNEVIFDLLKFSPKIPHRSAAKLLVESYPELFSSEDIARQAVRTRTGNHGVRARHHMEQTCGKYYRQPNTGDELPIPTPFWDSTPFVLDSEKCLVLADAHIPFHENGAIELAVKYGLKAGCKDVLMDGDMLDHYQESDFCKRPDVSTLDQELKDGKKFLHWLRKKFPKGRIIYKEGNHEERFAVKVHKCLPQVGNMLDKFTYEKMKFDDMGIELVTDRRRVDMGYLSIIHGHEIGRGAAILVNAARTMMLKAKDCSATAHWHVPSQHRERTLRQKHIGCWGIGCLCNLSPQYAPFNNWEHGFAVFEKTDKCIVSETESQPLPDHSLSGNRTRPRRQDRDGWLSIQEGV